MESGPKRYADRVRKIKNGEGRFDPDPYHTMGKIDKETKRIMGKIKKWPSRKNVSSPHEGGL